MKSSLFLPIVLSIFIAAVANAQQVIRLYEGKAPGSESWDWTEKENTKNLFNTRVIYNVSEPTLTAYLPDKSRANGTAVVIAPGGGFHTLSIDSEGIEVAKWLNERGVAAFVLKYRLVKSETDDPVKELMELMGKNVSVELDKNNASVVPLAIADAQQAMRYVRSHAKELAIQPDRIGFMGFSAGGTVTMGLGYDYTPETRPDFLVPIYAYMGALPNKKVPNDAPPIWICAASDDQLGLAPHSVQLYSDWLAAKKSAELMMYAKGGHGYGMRKNKLPTDHWIERFGEWLTLQGFLK
jgi:acetyl esterase/lipase